MAIMKKHLFLNVDFHSTSKMPPEAIRKLKAWLKLASPVFEQMAKEGLLSSKRMKIVGSFRVSLLLCGESRIRQLNREFRGKDKITDVLSFPFYEDLGKNTQFPQTPELFLGDLAICHQVTKRQAKEFSITYWDEFIHLFFHGLLHLLGLDHEISSKEEKLMQEWEDRALELFSKKKRKGA